MLKRLLFLMFLICTYSVQSQVIPECSSDSILEGIDARSYDYIIDQARQITAARAARGEEVSDKYIPVVVNIIHSGEYEGSGSNVSDELIEVAIEHANNNLRAAFDGYGATSTQGETHFNLFLATTDASGTPIDPIRRFNRNNYPNWPSIYENKPSNSDVATILNDIGYNLDEFLNIQIMEWNGTVAGFSHFPFWSLPKRNYGIFMQPEYLYGNGSGSTYDHVLVHELGHYIGLLHTFQSMYCMNSYADEAVNQCEELNDQVCDTPPVVEFGRMCSSTLSNLGYTVGGVQYTCDPQVQTNVNGSARKNFMDYVFGCDYYFFTEGQVDRSHSLTYIGRQTLLETGAAIFASSSGTPGCIDPIACNYDEAATFDNGSCTYPDYGYDCNGDCLADTDGDGVCDALEILGCTNTSACNYDSSATEDDGGCIVPTGCDYCSGETDGTGTVVDGDSDDDGFCDTEDNTNISLQFVHILDADSMDVYRVYAVFPTTEALTVAVYSIGTAEEGPANLTTSVSTSFYQNPAGSAMGDNINPLFFSVLPSLEYDSWVTIGSESTNDPSVSSTNTSTDFAEFESGSGFVFDGEVGSVWYILPGSNSLAISGPDYKVLLAQLSVYKDGLNPGVVDLEWNIDWRDSNNQDQTSYMVSASSSSAAVELSGCLDPAACNYNVNATSDDGSCTYPTEEYLDCLGECVNDSDADGVCDEIEVAGCTDSTACNYNVYATDDNGSCTYPPAYYTCYDNCINDTDEDGICDELEVPGCTDQTACNYNSEATDDNGSCTYAESGYNCDGSCIDLNDNGVCDIDEFNCGVETVSFDGFEYNTTLIGTQCWFVQNLQTTVYRDGTQIPLITDNAGWKNDTDGARSAFGNNLDTVSTYGYLYNWYAVDNSSGICPTDWHVPTNLEWQDLYRTVGVPELDINKISYLAYDMGVSTKLKADSVWAINPGTNTTGFNAIPSGIRLDLDGSFQNLNAVGYWWSSNAYSKINSNNAWFYYIPAHIDVVGRHWNFNQSKRCMGHGMSVRCVRD